MVDPGQARRGDDLVDLFVEAGRETTAGFAVVLGQDEAAAPRLINNEPLRREVVIGAGRGDEADLELPGQGAQRGQGGVWRQLPRPDRRADLLDDLLVHGDPRGPGQNNVHMLFITGMYSRGKGAFWAGPFIV